MSLLGHSNENDFLADVARGGKLVKCENSPGASTENIVRPGWMCAECYIMDTQLGDDDHNMTIFILYLGWCLYNVFPPPTHIRFLS